MTTNPANANVSYEWLNDVGARLGTGSTYTVKTSDTGRRIRVRVTGKNGTTGSVVSGWAAVQGNGTVGTVYQLKALTLNTTNAVVGTTLTATIAPSGATANIYWYLDNGTYLGYGSSYTVQPNALGRRIFAYAEGDQRLHGHRDRRRNPVHRAEQRDPLQLLPDRRHGADGDHCPRERNRHHPLVP